MATFTASEVNPLKGLHTGVNVVRSRYVGSLTVSEVCLLAKVPSGATVIDWKLMGGNANAASTGTYKIGFQGTVVDAIRGATLTDDSVHGGLSLTSGGVGGAFICSSWSVSASVMVANLPARAVPFKVSLSDGATQRYVWMQALLTAGSQTGTHSLDFILTYITGE